VTRARAPALVAALLLVACASAAREPWVLSSSALSELPVRDLERVSTYPQALATTLDVMQRDLGLPALEVTLVFLPDTRRFKALLLEIGYPPRLARDSARQLEAIGGHRTVLINQARLESRGWPGRVSMLAHELAHVLQYELGGGIRGSSAQWLREGLARWLETRVLEALEGAEEGKALSRALASVRAPRAPIMTLGGARPAPGWGAWSPVRLPALRTLVSFPEWVEQLRGPAGEILYDYAFVAVATLVEHHGLPAVLRYFELFAERQDPAANFLEAFGESEQTFEARLRSIVSG